jgi:hypothetical protein
MEKKRWALAEVQMQLYKCSKSDALTKAGGRGLISARSILRTKYSGIWWQLIVDLSFPYEGTPQESSLCYCSLLSQVATNL